MTRLPATPRWGNEERESKAISILNTLRCIDGESVVDGIWVDIGCGSGTIAATLADYVTSVVAIDPEPWPSWKDASAARENLTFLTAPCDNPEPPLQGEFADVVICNQVYEHVKNPSQLIRNLHFILKPGGRCYFAGPNLLWPIEPHVFLPFVHWMPRSLAHRILQRIAPTRAADLDAFSTHKWRIEAWFKDAGFCFANGLRARAENDTGRMASFARTCVKFLPASFWLVAQPIAPGFVYLLKKPKTDEPAKRS